DPPPPAIYPLSLHDALPICRGLPAAAGTAAASSGAGCRLRPVLPLAARAPGAGALADAGLAQRGPAGRAGQAAAAVDRQFLLEVAGRPVGAEEVAQGGAAAGDGVTEDLLHRLGQGDVAGAGDLAGRAQRRDAGAEQAFGGVDVAHADHD